MAVFSRKKKPKFYSLDKINAKDCTYNLVIGERSNGKTYGVLKYAIQNYFETGGGQLAIVRRWQEDIRGKRASEIFSALLINNEVEALSGGEFTGIYYYASKFYFCNYDDSGKPIYNDGDIFAHAFALSDTEHNKSISFPLIKTIMFDEFLTRGTYLKDEFILFMNTISTIVRQRTDVKIYMLGNTVNKYSPYFKEMGLTHISKMVQGSIDIYSYGESSLKVAVEYASSDSSRKENNFYFAFNNPKLSMITDGAWELDIYPHLPIKYTPKDILLVYFIKFDGYIYQGEIVEVDNEIFTYIHDKTTPIKDEDNDIIFSLEYNHRMNYNRNILRPNMEIGKKIAYFFEFGKVFYQDNDVGDSINNYLSLCRKM